MVNSRTAAYRDLSAIAVIFRYFVATLRQTKCKFAKTCAGSGVRFAQ